MKVNIFIMKVNNQENNTQTVDQALKNICTISFKRKMMVATKIISKYFNGF